MQESIEASVSLERDLHSYLATRLTEIETGLSLVDNGIEYPTEAGRIDLLAIEPTVLLSSSISRLVRVRTALGQMLGYMGCISGPDRNVRGILVASNFEPRVVFAAKALPNIKLLRYQVSFSLQEVS